MTRLICWIMAIWTTAIWIIAPVGAMAGDNPVVVELYTSQGCSSCPPADEYLRQKLANRDDVIALALHVDYWDYIGWKDIFADPANTRRQRAYAKAAGHRSVYTPQMIIAGKDHVVGNHPKDVESLIRKHKSAVSKVTIDMQRSGGKVRISASAKPGSGPMVIHLIQYQPVEKVSIKRGENAGRVLTYTNIVREWKKVADWNGKRPVTIEKQVAKDTPVVAIVQERGHGPILAAARLK